MQVVPWTQNYHSLQELNNQKATELVRPDLSVIQVATLLRNVHTDCSILYLSRISR